MTTPPSSPALSEARERVDAARDKLAVAIDNLFVAGTDATSEHLHAPDEALDEFQAAVYASGLAAGREELGHRWQVIEDAARANMPGIGKRPADMENDEYYESRGFEKGVEAVRVALKEDAAALRSPVGG